MKISNSFFHHFQYNEKVEKPNKLSEGISWQEKKHI
jgi:hypothetical protein